MDENPTPATDKTPPAIASMDKSFTPAAGKPLPPEGKTVEGWHSNEIIKCRKVDGTWENEDGETIQVEGWRLIEKPKEGEPPPPPPPPRPKKENVQRYTAPRRAVRKKK